MAKYLNRYLRFFGNIRLTIFLLLKLFFLILFATFSQVDLGIFEANKKYFTSWFIYFNQIPIYLGGYFIGLLLLINLMTSHATQFRFKKNYLGIFFIHFGLILLIIGSGLTSFFGSEMQLSIMEGQTKNFVEYPSDFEFVLIDASSDSHDTIYPIDIDELKNGVQFFDSTLTLISYAPNAIINQRGIQNPKYSQLGELFKLISLPKTYKMSERNVPGMTISIKNDSNENFYLLWGGSSIYQDVLIGNTSYFIKLRPKRNYLDFSISLSDFTRKTYAKSETPETFLSKVQLNTGDGSVPFDIQMNSPLRYSGYTFFQSSFTEDEKTSVFQVVKNPSWLIPYISSTIIMLGLFIQMIVSMKRKRS